MLELLDVGRSWSWRMNFMTSESQKLYLHLDICTYMLILYFMEEQSKEKKMCGKEPTFNLMSPNKPKWASQRGLDNQICPVKS